MPKMKFGVDAKVSTDSGFAPYEGPLPKPNVIYPVVQKSATLRLTGDQSKNPGTEYVNSLWEIESGECKGYTVFHRLIPGEHEIQQARIAQYMQAVCGKNMADLVHDSIAEGGKIKTIGGRKVEGVKAGMTFQRKKDTRNAIEGEETPWTAESGDIIPGWKPKAAPAPVVEDEPVEDEAEEEFEDDEEDATEEDSDDDSSDEEDEDSEEDEEDDGDDSEEEDELTPYEEVSGLSLVALKKFAADNEYEAADLAKYKGPKGKRELLALLVADEIVAAELTDEPPF